jgi:hypothetical protein
MVMEPSPEEQAKLIKNDRYEISMLNLTATKLPDDSMQFQPNIRVTDVVKGDSYSDLVIATRLKDAKDEMDRTKKAKLAVRDVSVSAFKDASRYSSGWTIYRIDDNKYSVNGPGLGWAGKIIDGQWVYHRDIKEMSPIDAPAISLRNVLSVNY